MPERARCPCCQRDLVPRSLGIRSGWYCPEGHGLVANLAVIRSQVDHVVASRFWALAAEAGPSSRRCGCCGRPMVVIHYPLHRRIVELDVCTSCHNVWFDRGELARFEGIRTARLKTAGNLNPVPLEAEALPIVVEWRDVLDVHLVELCFRVLGAIIELLSGRR